MKVNNLIIEYLTSKKKKQEAIFSQSYELASSAREEERIKSKQIFNILKPNDEFIDWDNCDKIIDDYCKKIYYFSIYDDSFKSAVGVINYETLIKSINRQIKLKDLGI